MTIPSTGLSSNIGGPQQPTQTEIEATAWTMVNRSALGLVKDTIEVPFSQLGGNVWKYSSDASRPSLKHTGSIRTSTTNEEAKPDDTWKSNFQSLVNRLPPQLRSRLIHEMSQPFEMRDQDFAVFENLLLMSAKGMTSLEKTERPLEPDTPEMERTLQNQGLAGRALRGSIQQGGNILGGTQYFLNQVGPNFSAHDTLRGFGYQAADIQEELNALFEDIKNGDYPTEKEMTAISDKAIALNQLFASINRGKDLQILSPMLDNMAAVAAALSLTPTSPTLFFGLKIATTGLFKSDSAAGLIGSELQALLKALLGGLAGTLLQNAGSAKTLMMIMMLLTTLAGAGTLAALLAEFGIGEFPNDDEGEKRAGHTFSMKLILQLLASSKVLQIVGKIIAEASGGGEKAQAVFADVTELLSLLMMTLNGAQGAPERAIPYMEELKGTLGDDIHKIEAFVHEVILNGKSEARGLDVALRQAQIAISKEDFNGLLFACKSAMELVDSSPDLLMEDLKEMDSLAKLLQKACIPDTQDKAQTGVILAA